MDTLRNDLRHAARSLRHSPGFTAVAVLTLALGIGANAAMFTIADALLLHLPAFDHPERLYWIYDVNERLRLTLNDQTPPSPGNFVDWRGQTRAFDYMVAWRNWWFSVAGAHEGDLAAEQVRGVSVSPAFFDMLGAHPELGRTFRPEEEEPGRDRVVVLSGGFWRRRFGADPNIVGQHVRIDGRPFLIIGVLPADFSFLWLDTAIFMPLTADADFRSGRSTHSIAVLARARSGIDPGNAQAEMTRLAREVEQANPATNDGWSAAVQPVFPLNKNLRPALIVLMGAVGCVLLIACVNVAGLLLVRAGVRQREMAIRTALGASRWRLFRQLLTESALLAGIGGIAGVVVAAVGLRVLVPLLPPVQVAGPLTLAIDGRVLLFTLAASLAAATALGIAPIFHAGHMQRLRVSAQSGGRSGVGKALLTVQIALSLMLVVGAALLVRSLWNLQQVDPGFHADHLLTMQVWLPPAKYTSRVSISGFYEDVLSRLHRFPEIREAAVVNTRPFLGWRLGTRVRISGRPLLENGEDPIVSVRVISPGYLTALGAPLIRGRGLADSDGPASAGVALVNEVLAHRFWPDADPIGETISTRLLGSASVAPWWPEQMTDTFTIVGVIGNIKESRLNDQAEPVVYLSYLQNATRYAHVLVRTASTPTNVTSLVQREIRAVDPDLGVYDAQSMETILDQAVAAPRLNSVLLWVFASMALVLSAIGIYGVTSYAVSQRRREFAIRIAVGASSQSVFRLVTRDGLSVTCVGIALGLAGALLLARTLNSLLYGVVPTDALTLAAGAGTILVVALLACWRPAWSATRIDPMIALRSE